MREIDIQCAERLGWAVRPWTGPSGRTYYNLFDPHGQATGKYGIVAYDTESTAWQSVPHFTTDLAAAWTLVEYMIDRGWDTEIHATRAMRNYFVLVHFGGGEQVYAYGDTAPEAITQAFVAASAGRGGE